MKITFLGTGTSTGIPMLACSHPVCLSKDKKDKRLRSSIMLAWDNVKYIIDCGPDFRQQMLRENVQSINGVLFTHEHSDHIAGFDDLRPYGFIMGEVPIFVTKQVLKNLKKRYEYVFLTENKYKSAPTVQINLIDKKSFYLHSVKVTPIQVMHGKLQVTAYRFNNIAYLTDVKTIKENEKKKLHNLDILIVNALRIEKHPTHFNLDEALNLIKELKPKKAYLTHISHKLGFHKKIEKNLPENVFLSYDGLTINIK